ncbi:aspartyl-phosphate phosphatase Spo0E family protein [Bacillus sp. B6(2022)]|nr:aspartyl-phosphate phosphatase Spo0E family protein [Bacillus sp. B6(2022)]
MNIYVRKEQLLMSIDEKRRQMVEAAQVEGYTGETTIKYSQELDNLMNEYQYLLFMNNNLLLPFMILYHK